ncbi:hypothetical protein Q0601_18305 [Paracoccus onubensis]|uniref:hypothetical protein n=1 Tax=Paracoccus onubensis TaxID=1675788 RepID=UPI0027319272|nr:hypothetical protein [Paracoccus onubensis]MDP0929142.1 hypothetical protein [Paracoccus onubensis]
MTKNIYLHIGHFKTGTTALQTFLHKHRNGLPSHNYAYPLISRPPRTLRQFLRAKGETYINHADLSLTLAKDQGLIPPSWYRQGFDTDSAYRKLYKQINRQHADNIIISSEEFIRLALLPQAEQAIGDLRNRLNGYDVGIVFYIREPYSLLKSWYNQINKSGKPTRCFPGFFMATKTNFLAQFPIYHHFSKSFGKENVKVLTYKHSGSDHIREFLSAIGCPLPCPDAAEIVNPSSDGQEVELQRLAALAATGKNELRLTKPPSLEKISTRVDQINRQYSKLEQITDIFTPSLLSCESIFSHYAELLSYQTDDHPPNAPEQDILSGFSKNAESSSPELAAILKNAAQSCA